MSTAAAAAVLVATVGLDAAPRSITELAPLALEHFGVKPPAYIRALAHAA